jgi:hypothetical protein
MQGKEDRKIIEHLKLTNEFIEAYEDDLIYIIRSRHAALTHPLKPSIHKLVDASATRLFIVTAVNSIEITLQEWQKQDRSGVLSKYFLENVTNGERVQSLYSAFKQAGYNVDREIFNDYLAIKYLRNTIVHGRWKDYEVAWIEKRGFPTKIQDLTEKDLVRIHKVIRTVIGYALSAVFKDKECRFAKEVREIPEPHGILKISDLNKIIWLNLARIDNYIYQDIIKVVTSEEYNWEKELSKAQPKEIDRDKAIRLLYLSAWRAGRDNHPLLSRHRSLAREALSFWHRYWEWAVLPHGLNEDRINDALQVLADPNFPVELEIWSAAGFLEKEEFDELLNNTWEDIERKVSWDKQKISDAFFIGKLAYELFPDITPLTLFTMRLPIVDPDNINTYWREANLAYKSVRLGLAWYECVERKSRYTPNREDFCISMLEEFKKSI